MNNVAFPQDILKAIVSGSVIFHMICLRLFPILKQSFGFYNF